MKINYYCYSISDNNAGKRYLLPLADVFEAYLNGANATLKSSFKKNGESVFLMKTSAGKGMYLFGVTRSDEIIKKVNIKNYTATEIYSMLGQDENLGFASYVFPRSNFFAFGSTMMAPKFGGFVEFFNLLLDKFGLSGYELVVSPLLQEVTATDVFAMDSVGRTTISLEKNNGFAAQVLGLINAGTQDYADLDGIEIVLKPKRKRSIKSLVQKLDGAVGCSEIERYTIKAVEVANEAAMEYYLIGKGAIHDFIDTRDEGIILKKVNEKIDANKRLAEKVNKYHGNVAFGKNPSSDFLSIADAAAWSNI